MTSRWSEGSHPALFPPTSLRLTLDPVTPDLALAFAQFLKRALWDDYRALAVSDDEAWDMQLLAERLREAFAQQGYAPR